MSFWFKGITSLSTNYFDSKNTSKYNFVVFSLYLIRVAVIYASKTKSKKNNNFLFLVRTLYSNWKNKILLFFNEMKWFKYKSKYFYNT